MNAFAVDIRVQANATPASDANANSVTLVTRLVCSKVTCKPTCGCTPFCITQSPLACW